jgi:N-acetylmuramoyl-L-alanine amidase
MTLRFTDRPSPNHNERLFPLDMLVLHYTGMIDGPTAIARLCDPEASVSAHYVVNEDGSILRLVPEDRRAWHAGRSRWQGDDDLNSRSIGIEIVNGGHEFGLPPYPDVQIAAVIALCQDILARQPIPQTRIVAHSDIAPDRKEDPGELFPWQRLAQAGVGVWPAYGPLAPATPDVLRAKLSAIGYAFTTGNDDGLAAVIRAFQRRWRPYAVTGLADPETAGRIEAVARAYAASQLPLT